MFYLLDLALIFLVALALVLFGWAVSSERRSLLEATVLPGLALLGAWALATWLVGFFAYRPQMSGALFFPFILTICVWKKQQIRLFLQRLRATRIRQRARLSHWIPLFFLVLAFGTTLLLTLAPPTSADYDSLVYHLSVPLQYERAGRIVEFAYDHHSYFPFTLEMLFGIGLGVRGAVFAKLFHWLMLPFCALILVGIGRNLHSWRAGLWAAALFVSMPMALGQATTAYIDLGFTAFALGAIWCFGRALQTRETAWLLWSGAFCGFCLGSKYFGALVFGFLGIWLLFAWAKTSKREFGRAIAYFAIPALVLGAPWYLRNAIWTGNPVFPFAFEIFGGEGWTSEMAREYTVSQQIYGFGNSLIDLVLLPWRLATTPLNVGAFDNALRGQPFWPVLASPPEAPRTGLFEVAVLDVAFQSFPGPAVVLFGFLALPFALWQARKQPFLALVAGFFVFLLAFWFVSSQQIRYLFPGLALLALVGGWGVARFGPNLPISRVIGALAFGAWGILALAVTVHRHSFVLPVVTGQQTPEEFLSRRVASFPATQWIGTNTPQNAVFAVYGEPRGFYLPRAYFWADPPHNRLIPTENLKNGDDLANALQKLGATHVLQNTNPQTALFGAPQPFFDEMMNSGRARLLFEARGYRIYELPNS